MVMRGFFLQYNNAPLLMINSESVDFMNSEEDYRALLEYLPTVQSGRHFFNPLERVAEMDIYGAGSLAARNPTREW